MADSNTVVPAPPPPSTGSNPADPSAAGFQPDIGHLLQGLRDIHATAPDPAWFPPAPGWWVVATVVLAGAALLGRTAYRRWQAGLFHRQALAELDSALAACTDLASATAVRTFAHEANAILKRATRVQFPGEADRLTGDAWERYLAERHHPMPASARRLLGDLRFRDSNPEPQTPATPPEPDDLAALHGACREWLGQ